MKYSITNLKSGDEAFARAFSKKQPNMVILNTGRSPELNSTFAKLNKLTAATPGLSISMYGYNEWLMYTKPYQELYHKLCPSALRPDRLRPGLLLPERSAREGEELQRHTGRVGL